MQPFTCHTGLAVMIDSANIDTDQIIPKQFLSKVTRDGFGVHLFHDWRYLDDAGDVPNPEFTLNKPRYNGASILLAQENFGCGSSREHAPWALADFGLRAIIAPSFADIFYGNSINNGLLPVKLSANEVRQLMDEVASEEGAQITVDLTTCQVTSPSGAQFSFSLAESARHKLLNGLDAIGLTLSHGAQISEYESQIPSWRR
ncbi:3-isopropylmalate dehydratase small subunit [Shewanella oneidensis MR-1]|uniref:3-isopropylmalate dehydratase small subunit n=1 Tax=Shewanella oneidensis (strain ATCC 700550 / JCM 31522 / CIP 106686 / LMG 19005 / NCIMB 14063 / MR-1) TaxID=211586 RepID=LEUD_SHEON|nr:3-isopropylmalate dehydratase small subunit [Shewanella oneidensis]Q8E9N5.1 RecName: Full=3-isopropylmalate dehydratase small subunit; AltName: Full=Alpha-IPM isomerase; Short=IPMI; AltName: Full=Isopropylmalate isomerase [Shewanella oneidensis MR-1]AAN57204.1 3-isopropylmalate dehydratase small subunit LeuD [Shewanella oneidensis MR-1]MDX5998478.1 3-isopropylmalate dehydratase small subunit [Shewanella oneidensis]MEE2028772.1 3-isopropylmalate dehydratase small subunit 1 [Shewanella oneiden